MDLYLFIISKQNLFSRDLWGFMGFYRIIRIKRTLSVYDPCDSLSQDPLYIAFPCFLLYNYQKINFVKQLKQRDHNTEKGL